MGKRKVTPQTLSPVKSVESWNIRNDGREPGLTTPFITVTQLAVRYPKGARTASGKARGGQFDGATNYKMRGAY